MERRPVRNSTVFPRVRIIRAKDLFCDLPLVFFLILIGCGGGGGGSGGPSVELVSASVVSISVTPVNPSIAVGATKQFTASGIHSDGTSQDITTQVIWNSSNTSVATITSSGLATSVSTGTTTITATSGSISGNTTLTVSGESGGTIHLAWDADAGVAGYKVYYGTTSGVYSSSTDVGNVTTYGLTGLTKGETYFIATTAYNISHNESGYSNEVSGVAN